MQVSVAVAVDVAFDPSTFLIQSDKPYAYSLAELGYRVRGFKTCARSESQVRALYVLRRKLRTSALKRSAASTLLR